MPLPGGYLLDTNILVALLRRNDQGRFLKATYGLLSGISRLPPLLCSALTGSYSCSASRSGEPSPSAGTAKPEAQARRQ
jgi:hypothetical protein